MDVNGDSLIVSGSSEAIAMFDKTINEGLAGFYTVGRNENGSHSLTSTGKTGEMSSEQQAFFDVVNGVMTGESNVSITAVINNPNVDWGSYQGRIIDVGDIVNYNSINDKGHSGGTREGLLGHELIEQYALAASGTKVADWKAVDRRFDSDHETAISVAENPINGNVRFSSMERSRIGDKTYTRYYGEKGGFTIESTNMNSKSLTPQKQFVPFKLNFGLRK